MKSVRLKLEPHHEFYAPAKAVPQHVRDALNLHPLAHQLETYNQLKDNHVVFNSFATGTGKTLAAYLHLLDRPKSSALIIAPTNALIAQHAQDLADFKKHAKIPHHIIEVDAARLRELKNHVGIARTQDAFYKVLNNPYDFAELLDLDVSTKSQRAPVILVTNPDLFYYALYGLVNPIDRRNLSMTMFSFFDYIIIDEFHYYDARQFCAFLFFIAVSHSLGYFSDSDYQRRLAILTATPNDYILKYFDRLEEQGLKYALVSPEHDYPRGEAVRTLAPMEVELIPYVSRQSADVPSHVDPGLLKQWLEQRMTGAVISDRLSDISMLSHKFRGQFEFEKVTGAVSKRDRPKILTTPLLLATPTVDIGYNFRRDDKNRQNIDFLVFIAEYHDEFWQRIGRAGRILGKEDQDFISRVQALIPEPITEEAWLELAQLEGRTLTHKDLKKLTENLLPQKPFNSTYIASQGLAATLSSFGVMLESVTADEEKLIEDALELVQRVFAPTYKVKTLGQVRAYTSERRTINSTTVTASSLPSTKLVKGFLRFIDQPQTNEQILHIQNQLKASQQARDIFNDYVKAKRAVFRAQTNFRGSGDEVSVVVYDPQKFLTNTETTTHYDLMHLLRYFDIRIYESQQAFLAESGQAGLEGELHVRLNQLLDPQDRPIIHFNLQTSSSFEDFENMYVHKLWAFQGLEIALEVGGAMRYLEDKARQALKNTFLPIMFFREADKRYIRKYLRDFKIYPREIEVASIQDTDHKTYFGIVGEMGEQALKHLDRNKRWNRHVSSYDIV